MRAFSVLAGALIVVLGLGSSVALGAVPALPTVTSAPTVVGAAVAGERVTGAQGTWTGAGTLAYTYQWHRCDPTGAHCTSITGATTLSYKLGPKDVGQTIGLTVTATNANGTTSGYANLIGPIAAANSPLVSTIQPVITGATDKGTALQVSDGLWSPKPTTVAYAWQRCTQFGRACVPIANATTSSYTAGADDVGHALAVLVTATAGSTTVSAFSTTAAVVGATTTTTTTTTTGSSTTTTTTTSGKGPVETALPTVTGSVDSGGQLTATPGTWSGSGTLAYAYQWHRCDTTGAKCTSIHGATGPTYKLVTADIGQTIGLTVTVSDASGKTSGYADLIGPVAPAASPLTSTTQPALTGTPKIGQIQIVSNGVWTSAPSAYTYSWLRCNVNGRVCVPITGATQTTYRLTAADSGHAVIAVVQAVFGTTIQAAFSTASAPVS